MLIVISIKDVLEHSPASFRPSVPTIRSNLYAILLRLSPSSPSGPSTNTPFPVCAPLSVRQAAAGLLAALHLTQGKAQIPTTWKSAMADAIGNVRGALIDIGRDGWAKGSLASPRPSFINHPLHTNIDDIFSGLRWSRQLWEQLSRHPFRTGASSPSLSRLIRRLH